MAKKEESFSVSIVLRSGTTKVLADVVEYSLTEGVFEFVTADGATLIPIDLVSEVTISD